MRIEVMVVITALLLGVMVGMMIGIIIRLQVASIVVIVHASVRIKHLGYHTG